MRIGFHQVVGAIWPAVVGLLLGLLAGGVWTVAQPERHRAEARVLLRGPAATGAVPAVRALAESSLLEQNLAQTLRLSKPPHISAEAGDGGVLKLVVEAESRERARQIDAEAATVLSQLVRSRFGPARLEVAVLDPAHPVAQTSPTPLRNLLTGGLLGLVLGSAGAAALARSRRTPIIPGEIDPAVERRLRKRIDEVAKRERALARRAGELAARESRVQDRESALETAARQASSRPKPEPEAEPEPEPERVDLPSGTEDARHIERPISPVERGGGGWNLQAIDALVREQRSADPVQQEEWVRYLFFLREHAGADGALPTSFDPLVNEVFGPLFEKE